MNVDGTALLVDGKVAVVVPEVVSAIAVVEDRTGTAVEVVVGAGDVVTASRAVEPQLARTTTTIASGLTTRRPDAPRPTERNHIT